MGVLSALTVCRNIWQKNWPEVHAAVTSGLPGFVFRSHPQPLGSNVPVFCYHVVGPKDSKPISTSFPKMATSPSMPIRC